MSDTYVASSARGSALENLTPLARSVPASARAAGVSRAFLYVAMKAGELPYLKIGDRRLIEDAALREWLSRHRVGGKAA